MILSPHVVVFGYQFTYSVKGMSATSGPGLIQKFDQSVLRYMSSPLFFNQLPCPDHKHSKIPQKYLCFFYLSVLILHCWIRLTLQLNPFCHPPHRFLNLKMKSMVFEDSIFEECYFEDITSTNTFFRNCTFIATLFYNTGTVTPSSSVVMRDRTLSLLWEMSYYIFNVILFICNRQITWLLYI